MKKGKVSLLSFEDDEEEMIEILKKSQNTAKLSNSVVDRPTFDLSQIKDRVTKMELNEEMILDGEAAELFISQEEEEEDVELLNKIKEAKLKRNNLKNEEKEHDLPDFIPITTKSEYWLTRDTIESEETLKSSSNSRLVREDLFNEIEIDDPGMAYTNFIGKSVEGRSGIMMTKKILERDIKTGKNQVEGDDYDMELSEVEDDIIWRQSQVSKGIEKGWNEGGNFYSKQLKLEIFIPPAPFQFHDKIFTKFDTLELKENIRRIEEDSNEIEKKIAEFKSEIKSRNSSLNFLLNLETFFIRFSRFLSQKLPELQRILENKDRIGWDQFFDNIEEEDSDLLDLPNVLKKAQSLETTQHFKELSEIFILYHFGAIDFDPHRDLKDIWEGSGLKDALSVIPDLSSILKDIFVNNLDKYEKIHKAINS